jgi:hypothetical protein
MNLQNETNHSTDLKSVGIRGSTPNHKQQTYHALCCGDSRSFRTQTMKENKSSRTKTKTQNQGQPKALFSTVDFSKVDPLYKCRSVSFYREVDKLFTFR